MKILKATLVIIGLVVLVVTGVLVGKFALDSQLLMGAAQRYDQANNYIDPFQGMILILGVGALGAFLLGFGAGLPRRTAGSIRNEALATAARPASGATPQQGRAPGTTSAPERPSAGTAGEQSSGTP